MPKLPQANQRRKYTPLPTPPPAAIRIFRSLLTSALVLDGAPRRRAIAAAWRDLGVLAATSEASKRTPRGADARERWARAGETILAADPNDFPRLVEIAEKLAASKATHQQAVLGLRHLTVEEPRAAVPAPRPEMEYAKARLAELRRDERNAPRRGRAVRRA